MTFVTASTHVLRVPIVHTEYTELTVVLPYFGMFPNQEETFRDTTCWGYLASNTVIRLIDPGTVTRLIDPGTLLLIHLGVCWRLTRMDLWCGTRRFWILLSLAYFVSGMASQSDLFFFSSISCCFLRWLLKSILYGEDVRIAASTGFFLPRICCL
jgi:hypothetical protein